MRILLQHRISFLFLFILCVVSVSAHGQKINKVFSGIKKLHLSTSAGSCKLIKGTGSDVLVSVSYTFSPSEYQPIFEQEGSTLEIKEDFSNKGSHPGKSSWALTIPDNLEIHLSSGSGDFDANDITGTISANTGSGDYRWKNMTGNSKINTGSGNVTLDNLHGQIDLNTGSGDVEISTTEGDLRANTGSGKIILTNVKGKVSANVGSGDITAKDLTLTGKGSFNSGSGDVSVKLASAAAYPISINSGSGDATLDFNGNKLEGKVIMTVNKSNGKLVAPFPFDKTEDINDEGDNTRIRKTAQFGSGDVEIKISSGSGTAEIKK